MAVIKLEALRYLADRITCAVPALEGHVCVGQAPPNHGLGFPSLAIIPAGRWRFMADQDDDQVASPDPSRVVCRIGYHEVTLQLQLATATPAERYQLEQDIEQAFFATEGHAGIIFGDVRACEEDFGAFEASFLLESDTWQDAKAFQGQSWSYLEVLGHIPALVSRGATYSMNEIRLGLTEVFGSSVTAASFTTDNDIERVLVGDDGTITAI